MADYNMTKVLEDLVDTETGSLTIANLRAYYAAYAKENYMGKVSFEEYLSVIESFYRNSAIAGEA